MTTRHLVTDRPIVHRPDPGLRRDAARRMTVAWVAPSLVFVLVGSGVAALTVLGEVALGHKLGLDKTLQNKLVLQPGELVHGFASTVTWAGHLFMIVPFLVVTAAIAMRTRRPHPFVAATIAVVGAELTTQIVQTIVERPRPNVGAADGGLADGGSFPAGHATVSAVVWLTLALLIAPHVRVYWMRTMVYATGVGVLLVVAWSRVALGRDWFTDVVVGLTVGVIWALMARVASEPTPSRSDLVTVRNEPDPAARHRAHVERMRHRMQMHRPGGGAHGHTPPSFHHGGRRRRRDGT